MELLSQYGLFLAKIATVVVAIAVVAVLIVNLTQRKRQRGELRITRLSEQYKEMQEELSQKGEKKDSGKVKKAPKPKAVTKREETDKIYCPECGEPLVFEEGCNICKSCGWSKCH